MSNPGANISDNGAAEVGYAAITLAVEDFKELVKKEIIKIIDGVAKINPEWKGRKGGNWLRNPYEVKTLISFLTEGDMDEWLDDLGGQLHGDRVRVGLGLNAKISVKTVLSIPVQVQA